MDSKNLDSASPAAELLREVVTLADELASCAMDVLTEHDNNGDLENKLSMALEAFAEKRRALAAAREWLQADSSRRAALGVGPQDVMLRDTPVDAGPLARAQVEEMHRLLAPVLEAAAFSPAHEKASDAIARLLGQWRSGLGERVPPSPSTEAVEPPAASHDGDELEAEIRRCLAGEISRGRLFDTAERLGVDRAGLLKAIAGRIPSAPPGPSLDDRIARIDDLLKRAVQGALVPCARESESPDIFDKHGKRLLMAFWGTHPPTPEATAAEEDRIYSTLEALCGMWNVWPRLMDDLTRRPAPSQEKDRQHALDVLAAKLRTAIRYGVVLPAYVHQALAELDPNDDPPASPSTRDGVIEECARVCDAYEESMHAIGGAQMVGAIHCAQRIRALKSHPAARAGEKS